YQVHFDIRRGRGGISVANEKVAFSLCYANRVLLGANFSYLGVPSPCKDGYFSSFRPIKDKYAASSSLALVGPWTTTFGTDFPYHFSAHDNARALNAWAS
ncbi:hypothetical protein B0T13DRAFT_400223, partial [Neurospora crassa]